MNTISISHSTLKTYDPSPNFQPDGLKRDLSLWSSGLFPFFEYAATNVRPVLLELFEKYYIPLQDELRPIMRSFILALLPGLEEETSETFDRVRVRRVSLFACS